MMVACVSLFSSTRVANNSWYIMIVYSKSFVTLQTFISVQTEIGIGQVAISKLIDTALPFAGEAWDARYWV